MALFSLFMEFVVFHTLVEKLFYEHKYESSREDSEILPVYNAIDKYKPLSMERLFMIQEMLK